MQMEENGNTSGLASGPVVSSGNPSAWEAELVLLDWVRGMKPAHGKGVKVGAREGEGRGEGNGEGQGTMLTRWRPLLQLQVGHNEARLRPLTAWPRSWPRWKRLGATPHTTETDCDADDGNGCGESGR